MTVHKVSPESSSFVCLLTAVIKSCARQVVLHAGDAYCRKAPVLTRGVLPFTAYSSCKMTRAQQGRPFISVSVSRRACFQ